MQIILLLIIFGLASKVSTQSAFKQLDSRCKFDLPRYGYCAYDNPPDYMKPSRLPGLLVCESLAMFSHVVQFEEDRLMDDGDCGIPNVDIDLINMGSLRVEDFPFLVRINHKNVTKNDRCMGVLVSSRHIITSATCAEADILTSVELKLCRANEVCEQYGIIETRVHTDYDEIRSNRNNFAIFKLEHEIAEYSSRVRPICLPFAQRFRSIPTDRLYAVTYDARIIAVQKLSEDKCRMELIDMDRRDMCVSGVDSCKIKSGTPLIYVDDTVPQHPKLYLFGIASNGPIDCNSIGSHAIYYGDVFNQNNWILQNLT